MRVKHLINRLKFVHQLQPDPLATLEGPLASLLKDRKLCKSLLIEPTEIIGETQFYEGLAINFLHDHGTLVREVRNNEVF